MSNDLAIMCANRCQLVLIEIVVLYESIIPHNCKAKEILALT